MKTDTFLTNRLDAVANFRWMHVCPLGEHPWHRWEDGKVVETIIQVIDQAACEAMANSYPLSQPDSRIDVDHESMDAGKRTAAVGWGRKAEARADGLWVEVEWNKEGHELIANKVYRFNSPVFPRDGLQPIQGNRHRVTRISTIALTNDPNLRGQQPLTNRRTEAANPNTNTTSTMDYKAKLLEILGLPPEATDEQIANGCAGMSKPKIDAMNSRVVELETQLANADLDAHGVTDVNQRRLFTGLLTNSGTRADALQTLALIKGKAAAPAPIHNRQGAAVPNTVKQLSQTDLQNEEAEKAKGLWIGNRTRELKAANPNRPHRDCFSQAESDFLCK